jgi:hypothetical protein
MRSDKQVGYINRLSSTELRMSREGTLGRFPPAELFELEGEEEVNLSPRRITQQLGQEQEEHEEARERGFDRRVE